MPKKNAVVTFQGVSPHEVLLHGICDDCSWETVPYTMLYNCVASQEIFSRQTSSEYIASQTSVVNIAVATAAAKYATN